ncbi:MAG: hybrid sensor histidine kinase/response regulator [Oleiphilaceae bacterium]|nr:hybrid sensor histidine kinase/response regulator [Oleiphilaceae bacterium]
MDNTVLIIEDSVAFAQSLAGALRQSGQYEVLIAHSFADASTKVTEYGEAIFAAVCDLHLPDAKDGAAVKLMAQEGIPCIAFTGIFNPALRATILKLGVADYVLKNGQQDIDYVVGAVERLRRNRDVHVLVVDDNQSTKLALEKILKSQCFQVHTAESGEEALDILNHVSCRIVMIDIVMKGMDGFTLLNEIRKRFDMTQVAILGVSGQSSSDDIAKFMKYGGNDFLLKPFEQEQVICRINTCAQVLDQFERLNQLNQRKNQLLGMAAHDIRGPLGVVLSATAMLQNEHLSEQGKMLAGLAEEAAESMEELLNGLLDISAIEEAKISIEKSDTELRQLMEKVVQDARVLAANKNQQIDLALPETPVWLELDPARIKEVVFNLLSNAVKYSKPDQRIVLRLYAEADRIVIDVTDEAGGIPEEERNQLFVPFAKISTTPTQGERSTGLGLAICQRIIKLHHGDISYRPAETGSIFSVWLPRNAQHQIPAA